VTFPHYHKSQNENGAIDYYIARTECNNAVSNAAELHNSPTGGYDMLSFYYYKGE
jgi:hypothetical protein